MARFVVWGKQAGHLLSEQPWNYAFGHGSALERFVQLDGRILLLGCDHDTVTFLHYAEHVVDFPGKRVARFKVPVAEDGMRVCGGTWRSSTRQTPALTRTGRLVFSPAWWTPIWAGHATGADVSASAESFLIDARGLLESASEVMKAVAADRTAVDDHLI